MDGLIVVAYPQPLAIEARPITHEQAPEGSVALAYYYRGHLIARSVVAPEAADAIRSLLNNPVPVALAATEDDSGNIDGRVCLVLPVDGEEAAGGDDDTSEPWKASVPAPPPEIESSYTATGAEPGGERPSVALLPIGNVIRSVDDRNHPNDVAGDAREMLENLLAGRARDSIAKVIDDLLDSI
jgi:hypothetical protein